MLSVNGRYRKSAALCACVLLNVFVALYVVPTLLRRLTASSSLDDDDAINRLPVDESQASHRRSRHESTGTGSTSPTIAADVIDSKRRQRLLSTEFGVVLEPAVQRDCYETTARSRYGDDNDNVIVGSRRSKLVLVIVVCSAVENVDRRQAIRSSWGHVDRLVALGVRLVFAVALPQFNRKQNDDDDDDVEDDDKDQFHHKDEVRGVEEYVLDEHRVHGDILQLNFTDNYVNLTLKTIGALNWVVTRCPEATYVAKTDDDVFVNVPLFVSRLVAEETRFRSAFNVDSSRARSFIAGHVIDSARPVRDRRSKWYTPETMFVDEFYPPYTSGTGYAMGFDVARRLLDEADDGGARTRWSSGTRRLFWLEDIFVSGMLASRLDDVRLVHDDRFNAVRPRQPRILAKTIGLQIGERKTSSSEETVLEDLSEVCWLMRDAITVHDMTPKELVGIWNRLKSAQEVAASVGGSGSTIDGLCERYGAKSRQPTAVGDVNDGGLSTKDDAS